VHHIGIRQARAQFSDLVDAAEAGEDIVITRQGRPVARLTAASPQKRALPPLKAFRESGSRPGTPSATLIRGERDAG
jgi:prevent-host-death family protein